MANSEVRTSVLLDERQPLLLTAKQLAHLLNFSTRTIWRKLSVREIPEPVEIGNIVRWRRAEVEAWIEGGCVPPVQRSTKKGK
jgi:excisionase family DNA binding protein